MMPNCTCFQPSTSKQRCLACYGPRIVEDVPKDDEQIPQIRKPTARSYPVGYGRVSGTEKLENNTEGKPKSFSTQTTSWRR